MRGIHQPAALRVLGENVEEAGAELAKIPLNGVRVNGVEVGGPYSYTKGPSRASKQKIYTCGHLDGAHTSTCPARIMTNLARRAFRRPVTAKELEKYIALVRTAQDEEGSFDEGLAVVAVLLIALAVTAYLAWLVLRPFLDVIAWSVVLTVIFIDAPVARSGWSGRGSPDHTAP